MEKHYEKKKNAVKSKKKRIFVEKRCMRAGNKLS